MRSYQATFFSFQDCSNPNMYNIDILPITLDNAFIDEWRGKTITDLSVLKKLGLEDIKQVPVTVLYDNKNKEVIYVGMAGKIKTSGQLTNHPISQRLQAPRIKDKTTGKEITTKNYIPAILELLDLTEIEFYILPCKENEPAAFIESILLYNYFKQHGVLPLLNNAY